MNNIKFRNVKTGEVVVIKATQTQVVHKPFTFKNLLNRKLREYVGTINHAMLRNGYERVSK